LRAQHDALGCNMKQKAERVSRTVSSRVLFGLSDSLTLELERVLSLEGVRVYTHRSVPGPHSLNMLKTLHPDVVFCAAEPDRCRPLLEAMRQRQINLPVVVVSRSAETANWMIALEAGAQDYCAPPFEPLQIRWILETATKTRYAA